MKNKLTTLLIVLLLLLNFFTIGTIWFGHFNKPDKRPPAQGPNSDNGFRFMARELSLSEEQKQYFRQVRDVHFKKTRQLNDHMRDIKKQIMDEIFEDNVDTVKVNRLLSEFAETQVAFERGIFDHFWTLKKACNSDQYPKLQHLMREIFRHEKKQMGDKGPRPPRRKPPRRGDGDRKPPPPRGDNPPPPRDGQR